MAIKPSVSGVLVCIALLWATAGQAAIVTVNWAGAFLPGSDSAGTGVFSAGDTITGSYNYDSMASIDSVGTCTSYETGNSSFTTIGLSGAFSSQRMDVCDDDFTPTIDLLRSFGSGIYTGDLFGGLTPSSIIVDIIDSAASALADESLPATLDPADWDLDSPFHEVQLSFAGFGVVRFTVDSFTSTSVPEPSTLGLLGAGMLGLGFIGRRRAA